MDLTNYVADYKYCQRLGKTGPSIAIFYLGDTYFNQKDFFISILFISLYRLYMNCKVTIKLWLVGAYERKIKYRVLNKLLEYISFYISKSIASFAFVYNCQKPLVSPQLYSSEIPAASVKTLEPNIKKLTNYW